MALRLLNKGASMASKDASGTMPVEYMDPNLLEKHLNECIKYDEPNGNYKYSKSNISINLTSLLPPCKDSVTEENSNSIRSETKVIRRIGNSTELKHLLIHPVVLTFLDLKWYRIRKFYYINLAISTLFMGSLIAYAIAGMSDVTYWLLVVTFVLSIIPKVFQILPLNMRNVRSFEFWLELVLTIIIIAIFIVKSNDTLRMLTAIAVVMSAIELVLLAGRMNINILILKIITYTFCKLLIWYTVLLSGFACSFHILFQGTQSSNEEDEEIPNFFDHFGMSLLKTVVMAVGEFDTLYLKFDSYPIASHIIFIIFVLLVAIILFNLVTGLVLSDTERIHNNAKIYEQELLAEYVAQVERIFKMMYKMDFPMFKEIYNRFKDIYFFRIMYTTLRHILVIPILYAALKKRACLFKKYKNMVKIKIVSLEK